MKKFLLTLCVVTMVFGVMGVSTVSAFNYANNITIPDKVGSGTGWYGTQEDQEVEPGMQTGQLWDLEAFYLDGSKLALVGGFDFVNGVTENSNRPTRGAHSNAWDAGDIFISTDGAPQYGPTVPSVPYNSTVKATFGYEYALHIDFANKNYQVIKLNADTYLDTPYDWNLGSTPWRWNRGGDILGTYGFSYDAGLAGSAVGNLLGGTGNTTTKDHNVATFDLTQGLDLFQAKNDLYFHFTLECGNDNLMGHYDPVPEPSTVLLLGAGLLGLAAFGRKHFNQK